MEQWKYNKEKHQVDEQPTMKEPDKSHHFSIWEVENGRYREHIENLRHILVSGEVEWKDGEDVTGKFKIVTAQKKRGTEEFSIAIPIKVTT